MLNGKVLFCAILLAAWHLGSPASLPVFPSRLGAALLPELTAPAVVAPAAVARGLEGVPPPLCATRCAAPPAGPVCAFDATGTARTFATLCELEAVSCRESTYYAITSLGEC